jgi:DNA repair exonuclease SbcCD ATPase subunit
MSDTRDEFSFNYFNYFTEIEEHFQRARGTGLFLLSPLDWALIETWKNAGVPLEAVLRGIDAAFERWRARKQRGRMINSLAFCAQAVVEEAQAMAGAAPARARPAETPFPPEALRDHLEAAASALAAKGEEYAPVRESVAAILNSLEERYRDLEDLEQRLTALEDKMTSIARARQSEEDLYTARRALDFELRPYRSKLTADQLARLEQQYLNRRLFEAEGLPRLSLFYVR